MITWKASNLSTPVATLHEDILHILFSHKEEIYRRFCDIIGSYNIDHFSIYIINPRNEIAIFSSTTSIEYNLINKNLWEYDQSFFPSNFSDGDLFLWEEGYSEKYFAELKILKEHQQKFTLGFSIVRKLKDFQIIYSFATRKHQKNLVEYYKNLRPILFLLGDYGYKLIYDIYEKYSITCPPPYIECHKIVSSKKQANLKLIINKDMMR